MGNGNKCPVTGSAQETLFATFLSIMDNMSAAAIGTNGNTDYTWSTPRANIRSLSTAASESFLTQSIVV